MMDTGYYYDKFWQVLTMKEYIALAASFFLIAMLVKSGTLSFARFKEKFGMNMLAAAVASLVSTAGIFLFFYFNVRFTDDILLFTAALSAAVIISEIIVTLAFTGKSSALNGMLGSMLGNLLLAIATLSYILAKYMMAA